MMTRPQVEDQLIRDAALDVSQSFIVRAPAGSGKTHLLIQRYLALLATVDEPEEVVAITFTRKAAAEMRHRVLHWLNAVAHDEGTGSGTNSGTNGADAASTTLAHAVLERDRARGWNLGATPMRLRIQTIDSLNASMTRQMPMSARFGAQPAIIDDAHALYGEAARATLALIHESHPSADAVAKLLAHLDNDLPRTAGLLAAMLASRDKWLRNLHHFDAEARERLEAALRHARERAMARLQRLFPTAEREETLSLARFSGQNRPETPAPPGVSTSGEWSTWPGILESDLPRWAALRDLLLTKDGKFRQRVNKTQGFPPGVSREEKEIFGAAKQRMEALLDRLRTDTALAAALLDLDRLPDPTYRDADWDALGAIVALLPVATALLWGVFAAKGQCDFTEVSQAALRALGEEDSPTDLALSLDYRIRHLLVDEFQDTSYGQFELLEKLVRGWEPGPGGDGRTFFAVGDPMQSIYRFRNAEVGLFLRASRFGVGPLPLAPLNLSVNFRSAPPVIEWVNATFGRLMPPDDAIGKVPYSPSVAGRHPTAPLATGVTVHALFARDTDGDAALPVREQEAQRVVQLITDARQAHARGTIAILVRGRTHLDHIVPALKRATIAFRAVDIDPLADRPAVRDVLSITRSLVNPADRIAWLSVLRSPCCGLSAADLAILVDGQGPRDGELAPDPRLIWDILFDEDRLANLPGDVRQRAIGLRDAYAPAMRTHRDGSLRDRVEALWLRLGGPATVEDVTALVDVDRVLDLIEGESLAQTGGGDIEDADALAQAVDRLFAAPDNGDKTAESAPPPVEIMTIHKSKGLEFDTVIIPALDRAPQHDPPRLLTFIEQPDPRSGEAELLVAPVREAGSDPDADRISRHVRDIDAARQREEDIRVLYVASTRARENLHLLGAIRVELRDGGARISAPRASSLLATLWPVLADTFEQRLHTEPPPPAAPGSNRGSDADPVGVRRLRAGWLAPELPASLARPNAPDGGAALSRIEFDWAGETARHVGTVVHAYLQRIAIEGAPARNPERIGAETARIAMALRERGVADDALPAAQRRVADALTRTLLDARGRWLLDAGPAGHREMRCEWRLGGLREGRIEHGAIDLSFVDRDGTRWIVDYKTGHHEGAGLDAFLDNEQARYRSQLDGYANWVAAIDAHTGQATRPIRLGLYFPLLGGWREWPWRGGDSAASAP